MKYLSIFLMGLASLVACSPQQADTHQPFLHGVASGDPLPDRVIIWTRITPKDSATAVIKGDWEIAQDSSFSKIIQSSEFDTHSSRDYTVKIDVTNLQPDTYYFYRFRSGSHFSPVGRTKTAPVVAKDSVRLAVVSCSNWEFGYFNAYGLIAQKNVDAVLHLGDYIYEYASGVYGDTTIGRINNPRHEIITLNDYRTRHAQYRTDKGLQQLTQTTPLIAIWDDHEIANNSYTQGAQNHQPEEGDYALRKAAARQAYFEWLPIREGGSLYRAFTFGPLASLFMLDERLEGREAPPSTFDSAAVKRTMLGEAQVEWLEAGLKKSASTWNVIGNQVMFSYMDLTGSPYGDHNLDSWEGYSYERNRLGVFIQQNNIRNVIFTTGDTHAAWAFDVILDKKYYTPSTHAGAFAVEVGTPSISSGNMNESKPDSAVMVLENFFVNQNPHLKFLNERDHGYLVLSLYPDHAVSNWYFVETLREIKLAERRGPSLRVDVGSSFLY